MQPTATIILIETNYKITGFLCYGVLRGVACEPMWLNTEAKAISASEVPLVSLWLQSSIPVTRTPHHD